MWEGGWIKEGGAGEVDRGRGSGGSAESLNCIWPRGGVPLKALTWQQALSHLLSGKGSPGARVESVWPHRLQTGVGHYSTVPHIQCPPPLLSLRAGGSYILLNASMTK